MEAWGAKGQGSADVPIPPFALERFLPYLQKAHYNQAQLCRRPRLAFRALADTDTDLGPLDLSPAAVDAYLTAVGDESGVFQQHRLVPPTALAAWALAALIHRMGLPPGTLHGTQELECLRAVQVGEAVRCAARLGGRSQRSGWKFTTIDFTVQDATGTPVLRGRTLVMEREAA